MMWTIMWSIVGAFFIICAILLILWRALPGFRWILTKFQQRPEEAILVTLVFLVLVAFIVSKIFLGFD